MTLRATNVEALQNGVKSVMYATAKCGVMRCATVITLNNRSSFWALSRRRWGRSARRMWELRRGGILRM